MQLAFEQVSFTYDAATARAAARASKRKGVYLGRPLPAANLPAVDTAETSTVNAALSGAPNNTSAPADASAPITATGIALAPVSDEVPFPADVPSTWGNEPNNLWALQDISFTVNEGDFLGIAGHTGSGKSTLLQHMNGLLSPTCGRVTFNSEPLSHKAACKQCRSEIGVVFQYPERQLFASTVYDDVAFGPRNLKLSEEAVEQRVRQSLEAVGLSFDQLKTASPFELSGGQQRRVAFAGVLAMNPHILVLDEPTAGLDPAAKETFLELIKQLHAQGMTIVMVSHNMDDLAQLTTRILVLNQGRLVLEGTPEQVFSHEKLLHAIGLDIPHAQRVANNLRAQGVALPNKLFTRAEDVAHACAALYRASTTEPEAASNQVACRNAEASEATATEATAPAAATSVFTPETAGPAAIPLPQGTHHEQL